MGAIPMQIYFSTPTNLKSFSLKISIYYYQSLPPITSLNFYLSLVFSELRLQRKTGSCESFGTFSTKDRPKEAPIHT